MKPCHYSNTCPLGWLFLLTAVFLSGCATTQTPPARHAVALDNRGRLVDVRTQNPHYNHRAHLATITNQIAASGKTNILLFAFGGLNNLNGSLERSAMLYEDISDAGYYPIFINWNTSLFSAWWERTLLIRRGKREPTLGPATALPHLLTDLVVSYARAPLIWAHQFGTDWKNADWQSPFYNDCSRQPYVLWQPEPSVVNALYCELRDQQRQSHTNALAVSLYNYSDPGASVKLGRISLYWLTFPAKMLTAPLIDFMGKSAWENMRRRSQNLYRMPEEMDARFLRSEDPDFVHKTTAPGRTGGLALFMEELRSFLADNPGYQITLVGHSMGTIVFNEMLRAYPELPYANIVYLGAACSVRDLESSVVPYMLERNTNAQFYVLTLHPQNEVRETCWAALDLGPRGSLLEWIDNFFAYHETPQDRTLGKWVNAIQMARIFPGDIRSRVHIKGFGGPRDSRFIQEGNPLTHGGFNSQEFWRSEFWQPVPCAPEKEEQQP